MTEHKWPRQPTAILVLHGIGSQSPIETLDHFTRSLVRVFERRFRGKITLDHKIAVKTGRDKKQWRDNYVRIRKGTGDQPVDVYEYYWANLSENIIDMNGLQRWVWKVTRGASEFYKNPSAIESSGDESIFFTKDGKFKRRKYWLFLHALVTVIPAIKMLGRGLLSLVLKLFPFLGLFSKKMVEQVYESFGDTLSNVIGDVAVYNSTDPKSSFYKIRSEILGGAVDSLKYLVDLTEGDTDEGPVGSTRPYYGRVLIAGHSLGSQIAFDAINRLTHIISTSDNDKYDREGRFLDQTGAPCSYDFGEGTIKAINDQLCGLITFGSPLDKIAFFLKEQVKEEQFIRDQILRNYHCFKRKDLSLEDDRPYLLGSSLNEIFKEIRWYNYHDKYDPISGRLDYYEMVRNIRRNFKGCCFKISHSKYWDDPRMYKQIVDDFILPVKPLRHVGPDPDNQASIE